MTRFYAWTFNSIISASMLFLLISCSGMTKEEKLNQVILYNLRVDSLFLAGNYSEAIDLANKSIDLIDTIPETYVLKGRSLFEMKSYQAALKGFSKALELEGDSSRAFFYRAISFLELEDTDEFLDDLNHYIMIYNNDTAALIARANYYFKINEHDESIKDYLKIFSLDSGSKFSILRLAQSYSTLADNIKSIEYYDKFTLLFPGDKVKEIEFIKAKLLLIEKNYNTALEKLLGLSEINYPNDKLNIFIADCYIGLNQNEKSVEFLSSYIVSHPYDYMQIEKRANIYNVLGREQDRDKDILLSSQIKWEDRSLFSKYFLTVLLFGGSFLFNKHLPQVYDRKTIKKAYLYFLIWPLGFHQIYLGFSILYFVTFIAKAIFVVLISFELNYFILNSDLFLKSIELNLFPYQLFKFLLLLFILDFFTLSYQVFISNLNERKLENINLIDSRAKALSDSLQIMQNSNERIKVLISKI